MARRVNPDTQVPTRYQAVLLLLASQPKGTYQHEACRIRGMDSMGMNFSLRALCGGVWRNKTLVWKRGEARTVTLRRYGRGWLKRHIVKRGTGKYSRQKEMGKLSKYYKPSHRWSYKITEKGKLALQRYLAQPFTFGQLAGPEDEPHEYEVQRVLGPMTVKQLADMSRGYACICNWQVDDHMLAAISLADPDRAVLWGKVQRGRDLRFPGWGPIVSVERGINLRAGVTSNNLPRKLPGLGDFQLACYGGNYAGHYEDLLQLSFPQEWVQWLVQWRDWWLAHDVPEDADLRDIRVSRVRTARSVARSDRLRRLDEVGMCVREGLPPQGPPERLFERLADLRRERYGNLDEDEWNVQRIPDPLGEWYGKPFAAKAISLETDEGTFYTITTDKDLYELGEDMGNCVGGYGEQCRQPGHMIVVLRKEGRNVALGEWRSSKLGGWGQIEGRRHREPTPGQVLAFNRWGAELAREAFAVEEPKLEQAEAS